MRCVAWSIAIGLALGAFAQEAVNPVPEDVYRGELVAFPGPWSFQLGKSHIILVSDEELEFLSDPDKEFNMSLGLEPRMDSLRRVCERAKAAGHRTLTIAFDHFFQQYRPGQGDKPRRLTPDTGEYISRIAAVSKFAQEYGLGLELSLLSPLEIGPAYRAQTGESGTWMHYRKGIRDPQTGDYSVQLWQQRRWGNNKGAVLLEDAGVRVFAFNEKSIGGTPYNVVDPNSIVDITSTAQVEVWSGTTRRAGDYEARRIRVHGTGMAEAGPLDRVLVVQMYRTPEMDYFSDKALPFLTGLVDNYADAGVKLNGSYADEMHIQQDWAYFNHHDNGEFALRYVSDGFAAKYAAAYGEEYRDFAKYLVYFCYGQEDTASDVTAKEGGMHVFGGSPEDIRRTALFRARYYRLLQDGVVDLFVAAKRHAEVRMGRRLESRAHATWAEGPTIDKWNTGPEPHQRYQYEYTSNFVWSDTVHQSASACSDYFKWGDFLTGNGNDHPEGGWIDRNYFALALACSTGILNEVPYSYCAHWGMPGEISVRRQHLVNAYGAAASPAFALVQDMQHRDCEVLMLYPFDLVSVEERFGSWMTQYGYANMVTQPKLLERGKVVDGGIEMAGRRFTTLVATFEPFPSSRLLAMMKELAAQGGRVVWSGPAPVLTWEGESALPVWQDLFGVDYTPTVSDGLIAPGRQVVFEGPLSSVQPQVILTDFLVDRIYPVTPREGTAAAARVKGEVVGTKRDNAVYLGFRPRDDQAASLGYETRTWFETLNAVGAYPATGTFPGVNDNTEYVSRTTDYLACRFPNGTIAISPHFRSLEEGWPGGFARDAEKDKAFMEQNPLPPDTITLTDFKVNGHAVTYSGTQAVAFRVNEAGDLIGFTGTGSNQIIVDGKTYVFSEQPLAHVAWAPVAQERRVPGGALMQAMVNGAGDIRIPSAGLPENVSVVTQGSLPGSRGTVVPSRLENGHLVLSVTPEFSGQWLYVVPIP